MRLVSNSCSSVSRWDDRASHDKILHASHHQSASVYPVTNNSQVIRFFRERIPTFACIPGCHDCCGPVTASAEEVSRLPQKSNAEHDAALAEYNCVYLGENGCEVYAERPLICRVFGTTPRLICPNGKGPADMIDAKLDQQIQHFHAQTRQVLL
jgi:hypothetical protein